MRKFGTDCGIGKGAEPCSHFMNGLMTDLELAATRALDDVETGRGRFEQFMELVAQVARAPGDHDEFVARTAYMPSRNGYSDCRRRGG